MEVILRRNIKVLKLRFETGNTVTSGTFQKTLIECYQKCRQYCSLYFLQSGKNCCQCPRAQRKKEIPLISTNVRSSHSSLMSICWVFSWSRDLFVLLLFLESSLPPPLAGEDQAQTEMSRQLIGSSWIDPRSQPYVSCERGPLSGPLDAQMLCFRMTLKTTC